MPYVAANLNLMVPGVASSQSWWSYVSPDVHTDVDAADYFSDGKLKGLKVNDLVVVTKSTATVGSTLHTVTAVNAAGAATVSPAILA